VARITENKIYQLVYQLYQMYHQRKLRGAAPDPGNPLRKFVPASEFSVSLSSDSEEAAFEVNRRIESMAARRIRTRRLRSVPQARRRILQTMASVQKGILIEKLNLSYYDAPLNLFSVSGSGAENTEQSCKKHWRGIYFFI
jgi:Flp pilus assembly secretin CpaC